MKKWDISGGLWKGVMPAVTCLFVLSMWSCGGTRQFTDNKSNVTDSLTDRTTVTAKRLNIPLTQAALRLSLADIRALPRGAVFTEKNGQASVRAERHDSVIIITATCDSLQLLVESQTREIYHLRTQLEQKHTEIEKPPGRWETIKNNAFYIAAGMFIMLAIIYIKKIWQRIRKPIL